MIQASICETDELAITRKKVKSTEYQIEVLAERISVLPKEMSAKPLINQITRLQSVKQEQETQLLKLEKNKSLPVIPVDMTDFKQFKIELKKLIEGAELNHVLQANIIKTVVHKIIIYPHGCEIFFHVGQNHYLSFKDGLGVRGNTSAEESHGSDFFKSQGSSLLTNGDPTPN